jgi:AraC family transcriptional regulator of adaptative response/methylated-DNA-[protein]-cysteine methyltransferase
MVELDSKKQIAANEFHRDNSPMTMTTEFPSGAAQHRPRFRTDAARWRAVKSRDSAADGAFVFAVRTTGIYCRPSCRARAARRENVRFFETCDAAERAGFRACRRCVPKRVHTPTPLEAAVAHTCRTIAKAERMPSLDALARDAGYSTTHFHRAFSRITGMTPRAYGEAQRVARLREELASGEAVSSAIAGAGFASPSRVYARGRAALGMTPREYGRRGAAQDIRYAFADTRLGVLLVAATANGVCAIDLGASRGALERGLRKRFAGARRVDADAALEAHVAKIVAFIDDAARPLDLPLDVRGTAFQHRVWQALQAIPAGKRTNYSEVARTLGAPSSVRAVARAIASNPVALVVPCHRVVAKDGSLCGYRWGPQRKAALLDHESTLDVARND